MAWPEDLSKLTIEELADMYRANEAWDKDLKLRVKLLMDGKAVGGVSDDVYASTMKITNKDIAECVRRSQLLTNELSKRRVGVVRNASSGAMLMRHPGQQYTQGS
jgi:hypothetical protein